jgi:hemoglobin
MPTPELCTEEEVRQLVHTFYAKAQVDPMLGPIFESRVADWSRHLAHMEDFWSSALRGTARFRGAPMPKHAALPGLGAETFRRWLSLFDEACRELPNTAMGERASELAARVANSLWYGYQMAHADVLPQEIA